MAVNALAEEQSLVKTKHPKSSISKLPSKKNNAMMLVDLENEIENTDKLIKENDKLIEKNSVKMSESKNKKNGGAQNKAKSSKKSNLTKAAKGKGASHPQQSLSQSDKKQKAKNYTEEIVSKKDSFV